MRRAIIREYDKLADKLSNYVGVMNYRFMNLCVKAEIVSLLPVKVMIEGESQKLEECANVLQESETEFRILPKYEEDLKDIMVGITMAHPEFKQDIKSMTVDIPDEDGAVQQQDYKYILLSMPAVDDDRYKVLKDGVKLSYDECKLQMEVANDRSKAKFAELASTETEGNMDLLKKELDKLNDQWNEQRDKLRDAKLDEINKAYNKWLATMAQNEIARMEEEDAHSLRSGMSMKLGQNE